MTIGVCTLEFHLPACRNLKDKRRFLNSLRTRNLETSSTSPYRRSSTTISGSVRQSASCRSASIDIRSNKMFQKVLREAERQTAAELISVNIEFL